MGVIFWEEKNGGGFWPFLAGKRAVSDLKHLPSNTEQIESNKISAKYLMEAKLKKIQPKKKL